MNLWGAALNADLHHLVDVVGSDPDVRVLVLASADPDFFIAHGDVAGILTMPLTGAALAEPNAAARAKQAVDAAIGDLGSGLLAESVHLHARVAEPEARRRMQAFLDLGSQTREIKTRDLAPLLERLGHGAP